MATHKNIGYDFFPKQNFVGREVMVFFHFDSSRMIPGKILRNDIEKPNITIIQLEDGRLVLDTECFYKEVDREKTPDNPVFKTREVSLDDATKHIVVGSIAARNMLDMDNWPHNVVEKGGVITEDIWRKMRKQGRDMIEIREFI